MKVEEIPLFVKKNEECISIRKQSRTRKHVFLHDIMQP